MTLGNSSDTDTRIQGGSGFVFIQGSNGYIGINDASPSYPLEINANTYIGATLETSSTATFGGKVKVSDGGNATTPSFRMGVDTNGISTPFYKSIKFYN